MGKVTIIKKSRKEQKCRKCGKVIPVGSLYYRGELNFVPAIVRCESCGLQSWEVTTSDYQLSVGEIVYNWTKNYGHDADGVSAIIEDLESIRDELQDKLDNMPEQLQDSDTGMLLQERIDNLDSAIDELNDIDEDSLKDEVVSEYESEDKNDNDIDYEDDEDKVEWDNENEVMVESLEEKYTDAIESALSEIDI